MRRSKGEVIAKILEVCLTGSNKTRVVYGSNLDFKTVSPYLDSLVKNGFIAIRDGIPKKYKTTDKGKELLASIKRARRFFNPFAIATATELKHGLQ